MKVFSNNEYYNVKYCKTFNDKLLGFMFKRKKINYGLLFDNCSLHTFFCFQNLDIIMLNKNNEILYIYKNVKPNKIIKKKKNIEYILEFSSGLLDFNNIQIKND